MEHSSTSPPQAQHELQDAFALFSQVSGQLVESYQNLEGQVASLTKELAQTRDERLRHLNEKERLATRLQLLLQALPGGVVVLDGDGRVQECNPVAEALLGEALHGQPWRDVVARVFVPRPDDGHEVSLSNGRRVNISTCSLGDEPGQILLIKDVTETRALQDQLAHLKRISAMGEMAASLAHQIRTPLSSALLHLSMLGQAHLAVPDRQRYVGKLRDRLGHLESLVGDMLGFARHGSFELETVAVSDLMANVCRSVAELAERTDCGLACRDGSAGLAVRGNAQALLSVVLNLVENAIQAADRDDVCVRVEALPGPGHSLRIRVSDDGPGMPADLQQRIFEPFFTTRGRGTGLGLAVVQAVARAHGAHLHLQSEPGRGSEFCLDFPILEAAVAAPTNQSRSA